MTHKKYYKNTYVFRQGEKSDFFYGIISGSISIRERKKVANLEESIYRYGYI